MSRCYQMRADYASHFLIVAGQLIMRGFGNEISAPLNYAWCGLETVEFFDAEISLAGKLAKKTWA